MPPGRVSDRHQVVDHAIGPRDDDVALRLAEAARDQHIGVVLSSGIDLTCCLGTVSPCAVDADQDCDECEKMSLVPHGQPRCLASIHRCDSIPRRWVSTVEFWRSRFEMTVALKRSLGPSVTCSIVATELKDWVAFPRYPLQQQPFYILASIVCAGFESYSSRSIYWRLPPPSPWST